MNRRVYIETTIPSFYFDVRREPEMVARREWTRRWWKDARGGYELVTSAAVVEELSRADFPARKVMPSNPVGDALHLALASLHRCDFLLTWNCRHLANANKFDHIRRVNTLLGLFVPALVTPLELLGNEDEDRG